jgi:hypothetical protein
MPLMRKIYTVAERVIVWLGEETFDTGVAIDFIPHLTEVARLDIKENWLRLLGQDEFLRKMSSLISLFFRPWWQRTWVIQEVALAKAVLVLCGPRQSPWSIIESFVMAWMDIKYAPPLQTRTRLQKTALRTRGMRVSGYSEALARLRLDLQTNSCTPKSLELSSLLWSFKNQSVTDPMDRIYGLLGLLSDHGVKVDYYSKSPEDIYTSFFCSCLSGDRGLDWFRWITGEHRETRKLDLPPWVPDFGSRAMIPISSFLPYSVPEEFSSRRVAASVLSSRAESFQIIAHYSIRR